VFSITYRGLRRIEELRDLLRRDRILEDFGILLSLRYFRRDADDALRRGADVAVSVIYADMDNFGIINKKFGQAAGDVVMRAYLEVVKQSIEPFGTGYRGVGDETATLIVGQGHERACGLAEKIRQGVESRTMDIETVAEDRKRRAKESGKNRVVAGK
jgi:diguanylate cyclase (GGDEF)-like protein